MLSDPYRPLFACLTIQLTYYSRSLFFSTFILGIIATIGFRHPPENGLALELCVFLINYAIGLAVLTAYFAVRMRLSLDQLWHHEFRALRWLFSSPATVPVKKLPHSEDTYYSFVYAVLISAVTYLLTEGLHSYGGGIVWRISNIPTVLLVQSVAWLFELLAPSSAYSHSGFRIPAIEHLILGWVFTALIFVDICISQTWSRALIFIAIVGGVMAVQQLIVFWFRPQTRTAAITRLRTE
jgi:hypothetical protein